MEYQVSDLSLYKEQYRDVGAICEANSFEQLCLWKEYKGVHEWIEESKGLILTLGVVTINNEKFPVNVSLFCATTRGKRVMFVDAVSRVVDWDIVKKGINQLVPDVPIRDAMNFHNCFR